VYPLDLVKEPKRTFSSPPEYLVWTYGSEEYFLNNRQEILEPVQDIERSSRAVGVFTSGKHHILDEIERYFNKMIMILVISFLRPNLPPWYATCSCLIFLQFLPLSSFNRVFSEPVPRWDQNSGGYSEVASHGLSV